MIRIACGTPAPIRSRGQRTTAASGLIRESSALEFNRRAAERLDDRRDRPRAADVGEPGFGGSVVHPVRRSRNWRTRMIDARARNRRRLEVDGGVKVDNIGAIAKAGADPSAAGNLGRRTTRRIAAMKAGGRGAAPRPPCRRKCAAHRRRTSTPESRRGSGLRVPRRRLRRCGGARVRDGRQTMPPRVAEPVTHRPNHGSPRPRWETGGDAP